MFGSYSLIDMFSGSRFGSSHSADRLTLLEQHAISVDPNQGTGTHPMNTTNLW